MAGKAVLYDNPASLLRDDNGGNHRVQQIVELIERAGFEPFSAEVPPVEHSPWHKAIAGLQFVSRFGFKIKPHPSQLQICGDRVLTFRQILRQYDGTPVFVWETTSDPIGLYLVRQLGFKAIAVPQNLESLTQMNVFTFEPLPARFETELSYLRRCDLVTCISREEQWLLTLRGLPTDFLQYFPPQPLYDDLLAVRAARGPVRSRRFLVLGNAKNPPTRAGIEAALDLLQPLCRQLDVKIDIAGFGTEACLRDRCAKEPNFVLHGTVDRDTLRRLQLGAQAAIVHTLRGGGALTRIPELLVAGIPVLASTNAARSAYGTSGVYCYQTPQELAQWLRAELPLPPLPERPRADEARFIARLQEYARAGEEDR